jgi:hypothetical protein
LGSKKQCLVATKVADPAAVDTLDKRDVSPGGYAKCPKWLLFLRRMRNPHGIFRSKEGNCRCIFGFAGLQNKKTKNPNCDAYHLRVSIFAVKVELHRLV